MLKVTKEQKDNALLVRLSGSIEESTNLEEAFGQVPGELHVSCKEVTRINSIGVKGWIKYFSTLAARGVKFKFIECSTAIVEQVNLISNFNCGAPVESIYVPFACKSCKAELIALFKAADLKASRLNLPTLKCTKCASGQAVFDDIEEEYFAFLDR